tara:strand:+ start:395 stop:2167 length:1773 start_codon:yes stop_codon:yes gene_type:complete
MGFVLFVVVLAGLGGGGWLLAENLDLGAAGDVNAADAKMTVAVTKGTLQVTVTEDGEVESAKPVLLKCQVAGGSQILEIVADGTRIIEKGAAKIDPTDVEVGDQLVKLDDSKIKDALDKQRITVGNAETALIQAEKDLAVAKIAVTEYEQGTYVQELQGLDAEVTIAEENLRGAQNQFNYTQKMYRKGFVTKLQLEADEFAVKRTELELQQSQTKRNVLVKFTKAKQLEDLTSNVKTATQGVKQKQSALDLEQRTLERINKQFENCVILAPQAGMVVYGNERGRWGRGEVQIEEGASVREHQTLIKLPDFSKMQVKVNVHESKVKQVGEGDRAVMTIQGFDQPLEGTVIEIANQPEPSSWYQAKVKEYATIVRVDNIPDGMVPGMSAEVVIHVEQRQDLLKLPVESIVQVGDQFFAWVANKDGSYTRKPLKVAKSQKGDSRVLSDAKFIGVQSGIEEGAEVALNPRDVVAEAKELIKKSEEEAAQEDVEKSEAASKKAQVVTKDGKSKKGQSKSKSSGGGGLGRMAKYDKNKDGKISKDEVSGTPVANFFQYIDSDKDGFVTAAEAAAAAKRQRSRSGSGGGGKKSGGGQ